MKKNFKLYTIGWLILFLVFNIIAIVAPSWPNLEKHTPSFWIGYAFVNISLIGQLVCAWVSIKDDSIRKTFYNISMFAVNSTGLFFNVLVGLICMVLTPLPYWVGAIICPLVFGVNLVAVLKAKIAADIVSDIDEKIESSTAFIYEMRDLSEALVLRAKTDEVKTLCKKIRDAFKYCDPVSNNEIKGLEEEIKKHFDLFKTAISEDNAEDISAEANELLALVAERNAICKRAK